MEKVTETEGSLGLWLAGGTRLKKVVEPFLASSGASSWSRGSACYSLCDSYFSASDGFPGRRPLSPLLCPCLLLTILPSHPPATYQGVPHTKTTAPLKDMQPIETIYIYIIFTPPVHIVVGWENRPGIARAPGTEELGDRKANSEAGSVMPRRERGLGEGCPPVSFPLTTGHLLRVRTQSAQHSHSLLPILQPVKNALKRRDFRSGLFLPTVTHTC